MDDIDYIKKAGISNLNMRETSKLIISLQAENKRLEERELINIDFIKQYQGEAYKLREENKRLREKAIAVIQWDAINSGAEPSKSGYERAIHELTLEIEGDN